MADAWQVLETDVVSGKRTPLAEVSSTALQALAGRSVPHAVIGATALAARGLPRNTADLDVVVFLEDAFAALGALEDAGFRSLTPVEREREPEAMYVLSAHGVDVDLLVASGEPESLVIAEATQAQVFGTAAPVATLEHLLLMYLYSNQPRHLGDFAAIVTRGGADLIFVERTLQAMHPEMLTTFRERVDGALHPPPSPPRPKRRG